MQQLVSNTLLFDSIHSNLNKRVCCLFLIEGFVSKECGLFLFLAVAMAAAAATPIGPDHNNNQSQKIVFFLMLSKNTGGRELGRDLIVNIS